MRLVFKIDPVFIDKCNARFTIQQKSLSILSLHLILLACDAFEQLHELPDIREGIVEGRRGDPDDVRVTVVALKGTYLQFE